MTYHGMGLHLPHDFGQALSLLERTLPCVHLDLASDDERRSLVDVLGLHVEDRSCPAQAQAVYQRLFGVEVELLLQPHPEC